MITAREAILERIRQTTGERIAADRLPIGTSSRARAEIVAQFIEYAREYKARVQVATSAQLIAAVVECLRSQKVRTIVVAPDLPPEYVPDGFDVAVDSGLDAPTLDNMDASLTLCAVAIAETGTIVLDGGPGQGRRALTLVPDHHVCLVRANQVVDTVPEAVRALEESVRAGRPLTWISGPSATSDIELTRVEGVHGARKLDLIVIE